MFAKVCGLTRLTDALHAVKHGATAVGFVFWPKSPRFIAPELAAGIIRELPGTVIAVGVFVNQPIDEITRIAAQTGIAAIQLHGDEPPAYAPALPWPVLRATALDEVNGSLTDWPPDTLLLLDVHDPVRRGGTGRTIDWSRAAGIAAGRRIVLAGGLTPDNVGTAIEEAPGVKNFDKVARFLENARAAFERHLL